MADETLMVVRYETTAPLELTSLTGSLNALADEYRRFTGDRDTILVIDQITEGSVRAVIRGAARVSAAAIEPLMPGASYALDIIAPFVGHWSGLLEALANYGRDSAADRNLRGEDKRSLRAAKSFVQPALAGNAIQFYGDGNKVIQNNFNVTPDRAIDIARHVDHLLAELPDPELRFQSEPMALYQLRDARQGDLGYIDRFDKKPKRLTFASDAVKDAILHGDTSPFDVFFFVSGVARTASGQIASYHIERVDGVTEKDAA